MVSGEEEVRITLRLSASLRDELTKAAGETGRSMNGEIVKRIAQTFDRPDEAALSAELAKTEEALVRQQAVSETLRANFEVLAIQLAGPTSENREEVLRVLSALRILGRPVPE